MRTLGGREDGWHNPAGWTLFGVLVVYILWEVQWLSNGSKWFLGPLLLTGIAYSLRRHRPAILRLLQVLAGIFAGLVAQTCSIPQAWPANMPPREYHGVLTITHLFQPQKETTTLGGLGRLESTNHPLWHTLDGNRTLFHLDPENPQRSPVTGDRIRVRGVLRPQESTTVPTSGFEEYLDRQQVTLRLSQGYFRLEADALSPSLAIREHGYQVLTDSLKSGGDHRPREQSVYLAMLTGSRRYLTQADIDLFVRSGTMHLFAISGLHIVIAAAGLFVLLRLLRLPLFWQSITGVIILGYYVWITGLAPSAVRAWVVVAVYWCGYGVRRKPDAFRTLCAAALIMLLLEPRQLHHPGFQLSYSVVAALLLWGLPILRWIPLEQQVGRGLPWPTLSHTARLFRTLVKWTWGTWIIGVAAALGSAPLIAASFHLITPGGVWINLPASLIASGVLFAALAGLIEYLLAGEILGGFFNQSALLFLHLLLIWVESMVNTIGFVQELTHPPTLSQAVAITLGGIFLLLSSRHPLSFKHKLALILYPVWIIAGISLF